ncbi:MAG: hypothetical protein UFA98_05125 [Ruminococcus sp.]|nr:hypothetical protein [Ruminococcus sp.]
MKNFETLVSMVVDQLFDIYKITPEQITSCRSGESFEVVVRNAIENVIKSNSIDAVIHYTQGSHAFPDIVIEYSDGDKYGIEVKCSTSSTSQSWKINGNSVLGSTKENVIDTYIIFGKTKIDHVDFRYKRYEDAISNVVVTHSPRYLIDLDVEKADNFFTKSGLSYKEVNNSDNPIGLITDYFKREGQRAWWLSESTPAAIRMFRDLSYKEQSEIISYCFVHFPEIFSNGTKKFSRCAMWMVTERSVVSSSLRDNFTAGGQVNIKTKSKVFFHQPRIFYNLSEYRTDVLRELTGSSTETLFEDWFTRTFDNSPFAKSLDSSEKRIECWAKLVSEKYHSSFESCEEVRDMIICILLNK